MYPILGDKGIWCKILWWFQKILLTLLTTFWSFESLLGKKNDNLCPKSGKTNSYPNSILKNVQISEKSIHWMNLPSLDYLGHFIYRLAFYYTTLVERCRPERWKIGVLRLAVRGAVNCESTQMYTNTDIHLES